MGRNSSCNRCFYTLIVARVSIHAFAWKTARNVEPWDCIKNVRLRNISCCGDAESAATHIRQRIQTASDLSIRRVVVRRIVGGEGPGDLPEQVRWRYPACDREIVERRKRGEVVSVLDVRQALLTDPANAKPRALGLRDEVLSRRLYIQQLAAMPLDDRAHAPQRGILRVLFPYRHATHTKQRKAYFLAERLHYCDYGCKLISVKGLQT